MSDRDSGISHTTNQDEDADFEGLERRKILASRAYQQGTQFIAIDMILAELNLMQYVDDFVQAGEDMIEAYSFRTDEEVDAILRNVEKVAGIRFPYKERCKIWKALRFDWFRSPESTKEFIDRSEVPILVLPKKDFRIRDDTIDIKSLDSDRQRMVKRRTIVDEVEGTVVIQDEVYNRMHHTYYELEGLERTVQYWMSQDPRKMARVDPKEEVLLNQLKALELTIASRIDTLKSVQHTKKIVAGFFRVVRIIYGILAVAFLVIAIVEAQSSSMPGVEAFSSQSYIRVFALYVITFWFITEVTRPKRRNLANAALDLVRNMHAKCRILNGDMISFRLKTHYLRQDKIPRYLDDPTSKTEDDTSDGRKLSAVEDARKILGIESGALDDRLNLVPKPPRVPSSGKPIEAATASPPITPRRKGSIVSLLESDQGARTTSIKSLLDHTSELAPEVAKGERDESQPPVLVRIHSSSSEGEEETDPLNLSVTAKLGTPDEIFRLYQEDTFADQRKDEQDVMDSLIHNLSSDEDSPEADEDLDDAEGIELAQLERQLTRN